MKALLFSNFIKIYAFILKNLALMHICPFKKNYHLILLLKWNGGEGAALKESMQKGDTHS